MRVLILTIILAVSTAVSAQTDRKFVREGNRMFHSQNYAKSEVLYRKALSKNAANPQAVYNLGCALMMQNKDSAAIVQYQKAAKMETNKIRRAMVWHNIGVICQNHKMFGDAIKAYEESLRNNPKDDETRYNLALCKRQQKNQKQNDKNKNDDKNKQKDKNGKDNKKEENKDKKDKNKDKQQQPQEQMSKDNAEQLLNAAMQDEQATQQRLRKAMQHQRSRSLQKNW